MGVRIVAWNVRHGGGSRRVEIAAAAVCLRADAVVLSEYRCSPGASDFKQLFGGLGYVGWVDSGPTGGYQGVAIASREPLEDLHVVDPLAPWAGLVAARVNGLSLVGVYGPGSASHVDDKLIKGAWWDALLVVSDSWRGGPCAIVGDFNNGVRGLDEIGQTFACSDKFLDLPAHGFRDAWRQRHGDQALEWSWWSAQGGGYRLDHCFVTDERRGRFRLIRTPVRGTDVGPAARRS